MKIEERLADKIAGHHRTRNDREWIEKTITKSLGPIRRALVKAVESDKFQSCKPTRFAADAISRMDGLGPNISPAQLRVCEYNFNPIDKPHSHLRRKRSDDGQGCAARSHRAERTVCDQSVSGWPEQPPAVCRLSTDSKSNNRH